MSGLLAYARNEVGLTIGSIHAGQYVSYTTAEKKAEAMREAGARVIRCAPQSKGGPTGWEVSFPKDAA